MRRDRRSQKGICGVANLIILVATFLLGRVSNQPYKLFVDRSINVNSICPSIVRAKSFSRNFTEFFVDFGGDARRHSFHDYLNSGSLVVEIGGYTGVDIKALRALYGDFRVFLYEPIYYEQAKDNLRDMSKVSIFPYGVGSTSKEIHFAVDGDATRPLEKSDGQTPSKVAVIKEFKSAMLSQGVEKVDLLQINCEGCEWEVLESAIQFCWMFEHIQVQFHPEAEWVPDKLSRYATIQDALSRTHHRTKPAHTGY